MKRFSLASTCSNGVADINERLNRMVERIEGRFEEIDGRFNQMENRPNQMNERIDRTHERMPAMMRWMIGTIALFGTIVTVLLAIAEFAP